MDCPDNVSTDCTVFQFLPSLSIQVLISVLLKGCQRYIFIFVDCLIHIEARGRIIAVINNICVLNIEHQQGELSVLRSFTIKSPHLEQPQAGQWRRSRRRWQRGPWWGRPGATRGSSSCPAPPRTLKHPTRLKEGRDLEITITVTPHTSHHHHQLRNNELDWLHKVCFRSGFVEVFNLVYQKSCLREGPKNQSFIYYFLEIHQLLLEYLLLPHCNLESYDFSNWFVNKIPVGVDDKSVVVVQLLCHQFVLLRPLVLSVVSKTSSKSDLGVVVDVTSNLSGDYLVLSLQSSGRSFCWNQGEVLQRKTLEWGFIILMLKSSSLNFLL